MSFRRRARNHRGSPATSSPPPAAAQPPVSTPPALVIDALGRKCPIPIIMLAERIQEVPVGGVVAVLADDVAARTDVPAWCRMKSQDFVREETLHYDQPPEGLPPTSPRGWAFHIRRTY